MRNNILKLILGIAVLITGCAKEEEIKSTETTVGRSRITFFPTFDMKGDRYMSIVKGASYSEPGVTAKEGTTDLQVTTTGTVNAGAVGVYDITYTATNKDGYSLSITRTVAVLPAAEQSGVDISGRYTYKANSAYTSTITKLAPGFYVTDNVWGASTIPSYILTADGQTLTLPLNAISGYGPVRGTGTLNASGDLSYVVDLLNYGISGTARNWKKI